MTGALSALLAATSSKPTSSGSSPTFIIFLVLIAFVGYFLLIRPQKQKQRRQREQQQGIGVGDEILTVGGIVGKVIAVDPDRVTILSGGDTVGFPAVGNEPTRLVLVRNAISRKVDPPVVADIPEGVDERSDDVQDDPVSSNGSTNGTGTLNGHDGTLDGHDGTLDGSTEQGASESEGTNT